MLKKLTILFLLFAAAAAGQQPPFGEKIDVNLVLLDAVVTDARGNQILGLDKDDFVVMENGVPQKIDSVDYFTNRRMLNAPENKAAFKVERVRDERYFVFFFDKPQENALFDRLVLARKAAKDFIDKQMKPNDVIAIVGHDVRLKIYCDFTSNKSQLARALDQSSGNARGMTDASNAPASGASILRHLDTTRMINSTGTVYEALELLGEALRPIRARKDLVLFSAGIYEPGEEIRNGMILNTSRYYDPMIGALNRADVSVYSVNLQDAPNPPPFVDQTLQRIAGDTNGDYFRFNTSFSPALRRIENVTNGYYLISYYTNHPAGQHGFQKVSVSVKNPDFKVRARQGYTYGE
jgi:VWFA-related protein